MIEVKKIIGQISAFFVLKQKMRANFGRFLLSSKSVQPCIPRKLRSEASSSHDIDLIRNDTDLIRDDADLIRVLCSREKIYLWGITHTQQP